MKSDYGSFLAVLKDGTHVSASGRFASHADFKGMVANYMLAHRYNVERFFYAWDHEAQEYTGAEVREVYFTTT